MKERPMLYSAPMVRGLLNDTKTQTRRIVKPQPAANQGMVNAGYCGHPNLWLRDGPCDASDPAKEWRCPYGQPGDRLWVRESFRLVKTLPGGAAGDSVPPSMVLDSTRKFEADGATSLPDRIFGKLRPGIHMPRWASRITLEITGVRVERLQEISEADAIAEGIERFTHGGLTTYRNYALPDELAEVSPMLESPIESYRTLWESINGPGSWAANPWVWVVDFKRLEGGAA